MRFFQTHKPECAVLDKRPPEDKSPFVLEERCTGIRITQVVEKLRSAKVAATGVKVAVSMNGVRPGLGNDIQNDAPSLSIFRVVIVRQHLELFHFFQRCSE